MKTLSAKELEEICFSLMHDKMVRSKAKTKNFESGRKKLLKFLSELEKNK